MKYKAIYSRHLGLQSLNKIKLAEDIIDRTDARLELLAEKIFNDIKALI